MAYFKRATYALVIFIFLPSHIEMQGSTSKQILVGKIDSTQTQAPYKFYDMGICSWDNVKEIKDSIGEILLGDTYYTSPFIIDLDRQQKFSQACSSVLTAEKAEFLKYAIDKEYTMSFYYDHIPIGVSKNEDHTKVSYKSGILVGYKINPDVTDDEAKYIYCLNNYFNFSLSFNKVTESIFIEGNVYSTGITNKDSQFVVGICFNLDEYINKEMKYYYDIQILKTERSISTRWDFLMQSAQEEDNHWKPLILFLVIVIIVSAWVFLGFIRAVGRDIEIYNLQIVSDAIIPIQHSWKQLSYDVFRSPVNKIALCSFIGTGIQILFIFITIILLGFIGILSPEHRGYLINSFFVLSIIYNSFNGFYSAIFYRLLGGSNWLINLIATSIIFPSFIGIAITFAYIGSRIDNSTVSLSFR